MEEDIQEILSYRYENGFDFWATPDKNLIKGAPFSTLESPLYLLDAGVSVDDPIIVKTASIIFSTWMEDGRFKVSPKGSMFPCQTASALRTLCYLGYHQDERIKKTFQYLLDTQEESGGWKCSKYSYGKAEETEFSTPMTTLLILDCFRYSEFINKDSRLDKAVEFLLQHWIIRKPIGPCHHGIGTLFMKIEYPFRTYNIFYYIYVLSFYKVARNDERFLKASLVISTKAEDGRIRIERVVPKLRKLSFCKKDEISTEATNRYREILNNINSYQV